MAFSVEGLRQRLQRRLAIKNSDPGHAKTRRAPGDLVVPAPRAQQNFWCLDELAPGQGIVNVTRAWRVDGPFDPKKCRLALKDLTRKHDCLRCGFEQRDGMLKMQIAEHKEVDFAWQDLRNSAAAEVPMWRIDNLLETESLRSFQTESDPLLRLRAYRVAAQSWILHLVYHHAIMDGWSLGQFCLELGQLYDGASAVERADLVARPAHDFGDHARDLPASPQIPQQEQAEPPPDLGLPFDFAPPKVPSYRGNSTPVAIDPQVWFRTEALAADLHVSPISVLLAVYRIALAEISGQRDFCIGNTALTRNGPGLQQILGAFVETLPIRTPLVSGRGFDAHCRAEQAALTQVLEQESVSQTQGQADMQGGQAVLNFRGFSTRSLALAGCDVRPLPLSARSTPFTLALNLEKTAAGIQGELVWNAARFRPATAERLVAQFNATLAAALISPGAEVEDLLQRIRTEEVQPRLLTCLASENVATAPQLLARAFTEFADQTAVRCGELHWRYAELDAASAAWAQAIVRAPGQAGDLVALALPRGAEFVAALLGILRAGRAFVPISPEDPPERIARILRQADPRHLIAEPALAQGLGRAPLTLDEEGAVPVSFGPDADPEAEDLAYVMFTSGSTGAPKGVAIPHRALANHLAAVQQVFAPKPGERLLSASATTFDSIIYEILMPLVTGGELLMVEAEKRRDPWHIVGQMQRMGPQHFFATPSMWRMLMQAGLPEMPLLKALIGGEALPPKLAARLLPRVGRLYNVYGPTEATVFTTWQEVRPEQAQDREKHPIGSQIGQPFPGYAVAVVDAAGDPVWPGRTGEIWISGAGLALGYYGSAERTRQSFVLADLGAGGERWYRTGDLGRLLGDGTVSCLGRLDDQVKISGQRVEPGEVENLILESTLASGAVVFAAEISGKTIFTAFYVPVEGATETMLRRYLQGNLPPAWVPGLVIQCDALPLNASGKLDRRALLARAIEVFQCRTGADAPTVLAPSATAAEPCKDLEPAVLDGWLQILGQAPVDPDQDFFAAGGNSLRLIMLLGRIRDLTGCHLSVAEAFGNATPRGLSVLFARAVPQDLHRTLVCAKEGSSAAPLVFLPGLVPTGPNLTKVMQEAPQDLSCYLLQRPVIGSKDEQHSFADQAKYYAGVLKREFPQAAIHLTGFSYGGAEAFETARQLSALNAPPASLTVIDNSPVFKKLLPEEDAWGEEGIKAEKMRRAHALQPWAGGLKLIRGDRFGLMSVAMLAYGWEDFVEDDVAVHVLPARHPDMLYRVAPETMAALMGQQAPDYIVKPLPGACDRRRVSHLLGQGEWEAALDLICGIGREHPNHPWAALVADRLARSMGKDCTYLLTDWIENAPLEAPMGVLALAWHAARAEALLRLQGAEAALPEIERARALTLETGSPLRDLESAYGDLLLQLDRAQEAVDVLVPVAQNSWPRPDVSVTLGISLAKIGRFQWAQILLRQAKAAGDESAEVLKWLAKAEEVLSSS